MKTTFVRAFALLLSAGCTATLLPASRAEVDDVGHMLRWDARQAISPESYGLVPNQRELAIDCPAQEEKNITCAQEADMLEQEYENSIDELTSLFNKRNCDKILGKENPDESKLATCDSIQSAICELESSKDDTVAKVKKGCQDREKAQKEAGAARAALAAAKANFESRRALAPADCTDPTLPQECTALVSFTTKFKQDTTTTIKSLGIAIEALTLVKTTIGITKDSVDAVIVTVPVGVAIGVVLVALQIAINALNIIILELTDDLDQGGFLEDFCNDVKEEYAKCVSLDTNSIAISTQGTVNDIDEQLDTVKSTVNTIKRTVNDIEAVSDETNSIVESTQGTVNDIDEQLDTVESTVNTIKRTVNTIEGVSDETNSVAISTQGTVNTIKNTVNTIKNTVNTIEDKVDTIDDAVDALACPLKGNTAVFVGAGCDGLDNDCDSDIPNGILRVDECDEDQVPPTLELSKDPPTTFRSENDAVSWFLDNTVVSDDCVPPGRLIKEVVETQFTNPEGEVTIRVYDSRCYDAIETRALVQGRSLQIDGPGASSSVQTFSFVVDGDAPVVTCGFGKSQDPNFAGGDPLFIDRFNLKRDLVDVQFWFDIVELPTPTTPEDVQVSITVSSNEYEAGREMLSVFKQRNLGGGVANAIRLNALLAPYTCGDSEAESPCLSEGGGADAARFYDITVVATDSTGNVGQATCTVVAVPEYDCYPGAGKGCSGGKGKGSPPPKLRPTRGELESQLASSVQRYELESVDFVYNTAEDTGSVPAAATLPPSKGKGKVGKAGSTSRRARRSF